MEFKVSFIGTGNMGGALLHAACRTIDPKRIHITDHQLQKAREQAEALGCCCETSNTDAVLQGNYIFLCVKPQVMGSVLEEIAPVLKAALNREKEKSSCLLQRDFRRHILRKSWHPAAAVCR